MMQLRQPPRRRKQRCRLREWRQPGKVEHELHQFERTFRSIDCDHGAVDRLSLSAGNKNRGSLDDTSPLAAPGAGARISFKAAIAFRAEHGLFL